jgi:transposase InsO family protein
VPSGRLAEIGTVPAIGTVCGSHANLLAEAINGVYKTELTREPGRGPGGPSKTCSSPRSAEVDWRNNDRPQGYLDDVPSVELEAAYAARQTDQILVGIQQPPSNPG